MSLIIGVTYAASDEMHQLFVPGRSGKLADILIDSLGIITGIIFFLLIIKVLEKIIKDLKKNKECE